MIGIKSVIYEQNENCFIINVEEKKILYQNIIKNIDIKLIFSYLEELFSIIVNWKQEYMNGNIIDGDYWKLSIIDIDGNAKKYCGKSDFPNNFEAFLRLNQKLIWKVQNG